MKRFLSGILVLFLFSAGLFADAILEFDIKGGFDCYERDYIYKDKSGSLCEVEDIAEYDDGLFDLLVLDIYAEISNSHNFLTFLGCGLGYAAPGLTLYLSGGCGYDIFAGNLLIEPMLTLDLGVTELTNLAEDVYATYLYTKAAFDVTIGKASREGVYLLAGVNYKQNFNFYELRMIPIGFEAGLGFRL